MQNCLLNCVDDKLCSTKNNRQFHRWKTGQSCQSWTYSFRKSGPKRLLEVVENPLIAGIWKACPTLLPSRHLLSSSARDQKPGYALLEIQCACSYALTKSCRSFAACIQACHCYSLHTEPDHPTVPLCHCCYLLLQS